MNNLLRFTEKPRPVKKNVVKIKKKKYQRKQKAKPTTNIENTEINDASQPIQADVVDDAIDIEQNDNQNIEREEGEKKQFFIRKSDNTEDQEKLSEFMKQLNLFKKPGIITAKPNVSVASIPAAIQEVKRDVAADVADIADVAALSKTEQKTDSIKPRTKRKTNKTPRVKRTKQQPTINIEDIDYNSIREMQLGDAKISDRIEEEKSKESKTQPNKNVIFKADTYYLNSQKAFINFIETTLFATLKDTEEKKGEKKAITCDELNKKKSSGTFQLLFHQKLVRDYLNIYTPYRGLFLYFGLGAGKTCSSIAIAEGLRDYSQIVVMTPASLRQNYINELKFCGNKMYKINQFWEFIQTNNDKTKEMALSKVLNIPIAKIKRNNGAWLINLKKPSNYNQLSDNDKINIDKQINLMIASKYHFINYNGLRDAGMLKIEGKRVVKKTTQATEGEKKSTTAVGNEEEVFEYDDSYNVKANGGNFFNNKVVIIDEVHNLISRIVNKLGKPNSIAVRLYELLMSAENCKIVFLSGTPVINKPNEIGIFYNILRGYIKTYEFTLTAKMALNQKMIENIITNYNKKNSSKKNKAIHIDYLEFKTTNNSYKLTITENPFHFINKYDEQSTHIGVDRKNLEKKMFKGKVNTLLFIKNVMIALKEKNIQIIGKPKIKKYKCLPDDLDTFTNMFINDINTDNISMDDNVSILKNKRQFQKRIMGLTSYFKSADEKLLPDFNPASDIILEYVEMSNYQLGIYEKARKAERKQEKNNAKKRRRNKVGEMYEESVSTYRIFSRSFCNFVFPPEIRRPFPKEEVETEITQKQDTDVDELEGEINIQTKAVENLDENILDNNKLENETSSLSHNTHEIADNKYEIRIQKALNQLFDTKETNLTGEKLLEYSPKFHRILENITNPNYDGLHLIYSNFRTLEGIGILKIVLQANGLVEFKLTKNSDGTYDINDELFVELQNKDAFVLYTGTESTEEKDLVRKIFNSDWDKLNDNLKNKLQQINPNNYFGEVIKCFMITSSGAEGITLKNTRFVHLVEPYWHPVREEQVIGRAVRICSHEKLPQDKRNVKVFKYISVFSESQLSGTGNRDIDAGEEGKKENTVRVSTELRNNDIIRIGNDTKVITSDEKLNFISNNKKRINKGLLNAIKFSSIDCKIHNKVGSNELQQCFTFDENSTSSKYLYNPDYLKDDLSEENAINKKVISIKPIAFHVNRNGEKVGYILKPNEPGSKIGDVYLKSEFLSNGKSFVGLVPKKRNFNLGRKKVTKVSKATKK